MTPLVRIAHFLFAPLASICVVALLSGCSKNLESIDSIQPMDSIIGGVAIGKNHYVATTTALLYNADFKQNLCTVTLISNQYAITAAHCVEIAREQSFQLVFGTSPNPKNPVRAVIAARTLQARAGRESETQNAFDVALLKFAGGLPPGYQAATLLPSKYFPLLKNGTLTAIAGYGLDNSVEGPIETLRLTDVKISNALFSSTEVQINQSTGHGACKGDSGGPAYFYIGGKFYFWGVASRGVDQSGQAVSDCTQYAIYSNALLFLPGLLSQFEL